MIEKALIWIGRKIGFINMIKIEGKGFDDLSGEDISYMIDAFIDGGNDYFDPMALGDFMNYKLKNKSLCEVRVKISKGMFKKSAISGVKEYDRDFLRCMAQELRGK